MKFVDRALIDAGAAVTDRKLMRRALAQVQRHADDGKSNCHHCACIAPLASAALEDTAPSSDRERAS